jgi:FkbM family methyltransferase
MRVSLMRIRTAIRRGRIKLQALRGLPIQIADGNVVTVPPSLTYLSTYVLLEQEDWFEKELPFVRSFLKTGMRALDIGANYGVYSVGIGKAVGASGRVWAFEPCSGTLNFLRHTLAANAMAQVVVDDCALSDRAGRGRLSVNTDSELNSLGHGPAESSEEVRLDTLDGAMARLGIQGIDFVKLDAEGEEARIVNGGREFFRIEDPLVMFEWKHGRIVNTELLACFRGIGYGLFRLVGPSSLLVPVAEQAAFDSFELNLFACKEGRAAELERRGLLLTAPPRIAGGEAGSGLDFIERQPFATARRRGAIDPASALTEALDAYAVWRQDGLAAGRRYGALLWALRRLEAEVQIDPSVAVLSMLARVALDAGGRSRALQILGVMLNEAAQGGLDTADPTWPAAPQYDSLAMASDRGTWLAAATAEAMVSSCSFSGYFTGPSMLTPLDWLHASPYASARMERRRQLQQLQAKRTQSIESIACLSTAGPGHRNDEFWRRAAAERTTMPPSLLQSIRA